MQGFIPEEVSVMTFKQCRHQLRVKLAESLMLSQPYMGLSESGLSINVGRHVVHSGSVSMPRVQQISAWVWPGSMPLLMLLRQASVDRHHWIFEVESLICDAVRRLWQQSTYLYLDSLGGFSA